MSGPHRRAAGIPRRCSEVQTRLARRICQGLHPAVVPEAAAVKAHLSEGNRAAWAGEMR